MLQDVYLVDDNTAIAANSSVADNRKRRTSACGSKLSARMTASTDTQDIDDATLVQQIQAGDRQSYALVVQRHETMLLASLRLRIERVDEAEDLAQEAFIIGYNKIMTGEFDSSRALGPWLRGIAINLLKNHHRKLRPLSVGGADELEQLINSEIDIHYDQTGEANHIAALQHCLSKLDDNNQALLKDHYIFQQSLVVVV